MPPYQIVGVTLRQALASTPRSCGRRRGCARPPPCRRPAMRRSSLTAGTNHAVSGSRGWAATAKPNFDGRIAVSSRQLAPASSERKTPLWCWHHMISGCAAQRARRWMSCAIGSSRCSGGMYSLYMPRLMMRHERAVVGARPHPGGRDADADVGGVARIDQHRIDAGLLAAGDADPLPPLGHPPQRARSAPTRRRHRRSGRARPASCRPTAAPATPPGSITQILPSDQGCGSSPASSGFGGKAGTASSRQSPGGVAAPQLGAEMAEVERGVDHAVMRQHGRNRIAEKPHIGDLPAAVAARQFEQTLAGPDMKPIRHPSLHQPPVSAWKTIDFVARADRIAEPDAVARRLAVDIDRDVPAERTLVVEHIAAQRRPRREHRGQRLAQRRRPRPRPRGPPESAPAPA